MSDQTDFLHEYTIPWAIKDESLDYNNKCTVKLVVENPPFLPPVHAVSQIEYVEDCI